MKLWIASAVLAALTAQPAAAAAPAVTDVMVLGTWHFGNPGNDLHNVEADDVRKPARQAELEALAAAIAAYRPTKIVIERVAEGPDLIDSHFTAFTPDKLREERDERYQIAYRLAHLLKHDRVYAIDEQPGDGEPDYFPFGPVAAYAQASGKGERLQRTGGRSLRWRILRASRHEHEHGDAQEGRWARYFGQLADGNRELTDACRLGQVHRRAGEIEEIVIPRRRAAAIRSLGRGTTRL